MERPEDDGRRFIRETPRRNLRVFQERQVGGADRFQDLSVRRDPSDLLQALVVGVVQGRSHVGVKGRGRGRLFQCLVQPVHLGRDVFQLLVDAKGGLTGQDELLLIEIRAELLAHVAAFLGYVVQGSAQDQDEDDGGNRQEIVKIQDRVEKVLPVGTDLAHDVAFRVEIRPYLILGTPKGSSTRHNSIPSPPWGRRSG